MFILYGKITKNVPKQQKILTIQEKNWEELHLGYPIVRQIHMKSLIFRKLDCHDFNMTAMIWHVDGPCGLALAGLFRRTILSWNMATLELSAIILGMAQGLLCFWGPMALQPLRIAAAWLGLLLGCCGTGNSCCSVRLLDNVRYVVKEATNEALSHHYHHFLKWCWSDPRQ